LSADRRLRDMELASRTADVAFLGYRDEVFDLGEAHARKLIADLTFGIALPSARSKRHWISGSDAAKVGKR
jgi:hypothetical protein